MDVRFLTVVYLHKKSNQTMWGFGKINKCLNKTVKCYYLKSVADFMLYPGSLQGLLCTFQNILLIFCSP